jgi:hypothetical protein
MFPSNSRIINDMSPHNESKKDTISRCEEIPPARRHHPYGTITRCEEIPPARRHHPYGTITMKRNPYARKRAREKDENEFDATCLPDNVLVKALEQAECQLRAKKRITTSQSTADTASCMSPPHTRPSSAVALVSQESGTLFEVLEEVLDVNTSNESSISLTQMMNDTDASPQDPDRKRLKTHCLELRTRLEKDVVKRLKEQNCYSGKIPPLMRMIDMLQAAGDIPVQLAVSMHQVRELGNKAAHRDWELPGRPQVEQTVNHFLTLMKEYWPRRND